MKMIRLLLTPIFVAVIALGMILCQGCGSNETHKEDSQGRAQSKKGEGHGKEHEEHAEEHDGEHGEEGHEGEENEVVLSDTAAVLAGITTEPVRLGNIDRSFVLPGEIVPDGDRVLHVAPRFAGIVKQVRKDIGEAVNVGDVLAVIESNENLSPYTVTAHLAGRVIEKHVTPGEFVSEDRDMFVISDLSRVWVNIAVYSKDASRIKPGQRVTINALGTGHSAQAVISYVSPVFNEETRSLTARAVLPNPDGAWRPGTFVKAAIFESASDKSLLVCKDAVQIVGEKPCVFVKEAANTYHAVPVRTGEAGITHTQILAGLAEGDTYVCNGAFELKAQLVVKSLGGGHAGHGH